MCKGMACHIVVRPPQNVKYLQSIWTRGVPLLQSTYLDRGGQILRGSHFRPAPRGEMLHSAQDVFFYLN